MCVLLRSRRRESRVRRDYRRELARCTGRPGCPANLHTSTCAELRDLIREEPGS